MFEARHAPEQEIRESQTGGLSVHGPRAADPRVGQEIHRQVRDVDADRQLVVAAHQREVVRHLVAVGVEDAAVHAADGERVRTVNDISPGL